MLVSAFALAIFTPGPSSAQPTLTVIYHFTGKSDGGFPLASYGGCTRESLRDSFRGRLRLRVFQRRRILSAG